MEQRSRFPSIKGRTVAERFWEKVDTSGDCWLWVGAKNSHGYGVMRIAGKDIYVHRLTLELAGRPVPAGMLACHTCDKPLCVRPEHVYAGTPASNVADMDARGRANRIRDLTNWRTALRPPTPRKTHCPSGHPYEGDNVYVRPVDGKRKCRACLKAQNVTKYARTLAARTPADMARRREWERGYRARKRHQVGQ